jgi:hypothetical protein
LILFSRVSGTFFDARIGFEENSGCCE